jgi:hypothetical protein
MFDDHDRQQLRRFYFSAWDKARRGLPMEPLERQVAELIGEHPEYHAFIEQPQTALEQEFDPATGRGNPFLHMGMHMALREQVGTDRPPGIRAVWQALCLRHGDAHAAEHAMMEALAEALWTAQRDARPPDESAYLQTLRKMAGLTPQDPPGH